MNTKNAAGLTHPKIARNTLWTWHVMHLRVRTEQGPTHICPTNRLLSPALFTRAKTAVRPCYPYKACSTHVPSPSLSLSLSQSQSQSQHEPASSNLANEPHILPKKDTQIHLLYPNYNTRDRGRPWEALDGLILQMQKGGKPYMSSKCLVVDRVQYSVFTALAPPPQPLPLHGRQIKIMPLMQVSLEPQFQYEDASLIRPLLLCRGYWLKGFALIGNIILHHGGIGHKPP
jgi:hypothetical protein